MRRSRRARVAVTLAFAGGLGAVACSSSSKGSLILAVSTDMRTPKDINVVSVYITTDGAPKYDYLGRVLPDGTVALPSTLAIVEPDSPGAKVRIRVTAFQEANARVMRDVVTTVPHQATALLRLPLSFLDDGSGIGQIPTEMVPEGKGAAVDGDSQFDALSLKSSCDFGNKGQTSINGQCVAADVDSSQLPAVPPTRRSSARPARSRKTARCPGASTWPPASPARCRSPRSTSAADGSCTATLPSGVDPSKLNLAIVTNSTGECLAANQCYVPLDDDRALYTVKGSAVSMSPGVCAKLAGAALAAVSGPCGPKPATQPVCEPVTPSEVDDAGASSSCDGNWIITCASTGTCSGGSVPLTVIGTSAQIAMPQSGGTSAGTIEVPIDGTLDPSTCIATLQKPASDASCDPAATITVDLRAGTVTGVPCGSESSAGTCTNTALSCTVARGTYDAGVSDAGAGPDVMIVADAGADVSAPPIDAGGDASISDSGPDTGPVDSGAVDAIADVVSEVAPPPPDAGVSDGASTDAGACVLIPPGAVSWWRGEGDTTDVYGLNPATWIGGTQSRTPPARWAPASTSPARASSRPTRPA